MMASTSNSSSVVSSTDFSGNFDPGIFGRFRGDLWLYCCRIGMISLRFFL